MKILFLDIDGVLNSSQYFVQFRNQIPIAKLDPQAVALLNQITDTTGAYIVVSSTWRYAFAHNLSGLQAYLSKYGVIGKIIGMTPIDDDSRCQQIQNWLDTNSGIDSFVILDDYDLGGKQLDKYLVQTSMQNGLTPDDVQQAIKLLNG